MYKILKTFKKFIGTRLSELIRINLIIIGMILVREHIYNKIITKHKITIIFFKVIPFSIGFFGNYFIPIILRLEDIYFKRLNICSLYFVSLKLIFYINSIIIDKGIKKGWTIYPPLKRKEYISGNKTNIGILSLHIKGISSLIGSLNFIVRIFNQRIFSNYLNFPIFIWKQIIKKFLLLISLPVLKKGITILLLDRLKNTKFFNKNKGKDSILFQHLFWFFGHPEVYVLILPRFGIIRHKILWITIKKEVYSIIGIIYKIIIIGLLGFIVWKHHIYIVGIDKDSRKYFTKKTIVIKIPTGIKVFSWITRINSSLIPNHPVTIWIFIFLFLFTIGGITGIVLKNKKLDRILHDTYFVVKHFHYVLRIGKVFGIIKGIQNWKILIFGVIINQKLSFIKSILLFIGVNITFFPIHFKGLKGIPRRYIDYKDIFIKYNNISNNGSNIKRLKLFLFINNFLLKYLNNKKIININKNSYLLEWKIKFKEKNFFNKIKIIL